MKATQEKDLCAHAKLLETSDKKKHATSSSKKPLEEEGSAGAARNKVGGASSSGNLNPSTPSSLGPAFSPESTKIQAESQATPEEVHAPVQQEAAVAQPDAGMGNPDGVSPPSLARPEGVERMGKTIPKTATKVPRDTSSNASTC